MNSVISAQFNTDKLFIRGELDKYSLSTGFSATQNPITESNDSFVSIVLPFPQAINQFPSNQPLGIAERPDSSRRELTKGQL